MRLSTYSDYALRVLMQAALRQPRLVTVDEVSTTFSISRHHLVKVVHDLGRSGYLRTRRGSGGGFTLALRPDNISIADIVRLGEETDTFIDCQEVHGQSCRLRPACRLKAILDEAAAGFFQVLERYSIADLVNQPARMRTVLGLSAVNHCRTHAASPAK